jgi:serine/threonine-protein kinase
VVPEIASVPAPDAVRAQLQRIVASDQFARSRRLSRFLAFTVEEVLAGHADGLKEYLVGVEVFGRKPDFDPRNDGIVRVQAVNLRARLAEYYAAQGRDDSVIIEYVKGSYAPVLRRRVRNDVPVAPTAAADSIAVLPFVNMSSDPENEYFTDGLTEELIGALSNVHGLRVVARTSVFQYKGKPADVRKIGLALGARSILEGSVRKSGERLCINAQLVDAQNGYESWSRTYHVQMQDLFSVQQEIARAIAATVRATEGVVLRRRTASLDAYHSYLKGRFYLNQWKEDAFQKSIGFFEAAIRGDPRMAQAYSGLADALFVVACCGKMDPRELMPRARAAAEKAVELDDCSAEARVSLGAIRAVCDWNWSAAEVEFRYALDLDPDSATAWQWYGVLCLIPQNRLSEAETAIRHARELDPLSPPINTSLGLLYYVRNDFDEAIRYFDKALEIDPAFYLAHWWLGAIYLSRSMLLKAFTALRKAGVFSRDRLYNPVKFTYGDALLSKQTRIRKVLEQFGTPSPDHYVSPFVVAAVHAALGEDDAALEWLRKAYLAHDAWLTWLAVDRRFERLRPDPRFQALLKDIRVSN